MLSQLKNSVKSFWLQNLCIIDIILNVSIIKITWDKEVLIKSVLQKEVKFLKAHGLHEGTEDFLSEMLVVIVTKGKFIREIKIAFQSEGFSTKNKH